MDITSLIGPMVGLGMIAWGLMVEGGSLSSMFQLTAALIVFGGSFGSLLVAYPLRDVIYAFKHLGTWLKGSVADHDQIRRDILDMAQMARRESVISLGKVVDNLSFPPLQQAVRLAIEGTAPELIKSSQTLSKEVTHDEQEVAARFWEDFGTVAPTVGIIGAVIGLIQVMENLDKAEMIGPGIAVAFTATLYGVGAANLLFLPIAKKLKRKFSDEATAREMVILGMEAILSGTSPKMINETLLPFCRLPEGTEGGDEEGGDSKKKKK